jgi:succinyl-diaminopimelate desuccinylase
MRARSRAVDEVGREPSDLSPRQPCDDENAFARVLALLDRRAERIELVQLRALRIRQEQADGLEALGKTVGNPDAQLVEPFVRERRDLQRIGVAIREMPAVLAVDGVDLVDHELDGQLVGPDLAQHPIDGCDLLDQRVLCHRAVDDMENEVGDERLLERRSEALDQLMGQAADEADRVGDEIAPAVVLEAARRRIERLEQPVAHRDSGVRERVQERRLADVCVAGERDCRDLGTPPLLTANVALPAQLLEPALQERDALPREPTVRLELRLTRASCADAAAEPLEVLPHAPHAREVVLELCELDLELSLGGDGVLREDVEDQLGPVDDPCLELVLEQALLRRRELVVDDQHLGPRVPVRLLELVELPLAHIRAWIGMLAVLDEPRHGLDARSARELLELCELAVGIDALREHGQDEPALGLRARRGIGLSDRHLQVIMTPVVPTPDLAARTLQLVDVPSESRSEAALVRLVRELVPLPALYDDGEVLLYGTGPVVLAGHLDTIPAQENIPGHIDGGAVHGLGASDMKAGVAVMIELARAGVPGRYLFFTREEIPVVESPLPVLFDSGLIADAQLAIVLEPTDCILHAGCLGNIQARVTFKGKSAHSARPWTGINAIHELVRGLQGLGELEPREVELDGLTFREVVSAVRVEGGIASNVVPARASVELNFRYAPGRTREAAEARLRELVPVGELEVLSNSPSAPPALMNPLTAKLRELVPEVAPKQAWTPVAQFAERGIDAINYGPGATAYAHKQDEQVPIEDLERCFEILRTFLDTV